MSELHAETEGLHLQRIIKVGAGLLMGWCGKTKETALNSIRLKCGVNKCPKDLACR